jgi:hypothetical protein
MTEIERRSLPDRETLLRDYMRPCRPFVAEDLFAGERIREVRSPVAARELWADVELHFRSEYLEAFLSRAGLDTARAAPPRRMTLATYLDLVAPEEHADSTLLCSEEPAPPAIAATFAIPSVVEGPDDPPYTQVFLGRRGQHAHLHFDGDGRHGFLYQVYGRKRVLLFPPASARRLQPFGVYSGWFVDRLTAEERTALLAFADGCELVLEPGEALFLPAFAYHYVEYVEDAMSISVDFGRNRWVRQLVDAFPHTSHLPLVGARLVDDERLTEEHPGFLAELERTVASLPADARDRRTALAALAARLCGDSADGVRSPLEEVLLAAESAGFRRGTSRRAPRDSSH